MKPDVAAKWVKALRSGEYKQDKNALLTRTKKKDGYCCLGVLCGLYQKETGKGKWKQCGKPNSYGEYLLVFLGEDGHLPQTVRKWAGMKTVSGVYKVGAGLANDNDNGKKFVTLAKTIEKYVDEL